MDTETVLARILPKVAALLKATLDTLAEQEQPSFYTLEEGTQTVLPQIGQVLLQALAEVQGSGLVGPERACPACGGAQRYHDQARPLQLTSSVGGIRLERRA
jgi:hypothetical protein